MNTSTSTNRLDQIAVRSRQGRIRDIAFAVMIAVFVILSGFALREAGAMPLSKAQPAKAGASSVHQLASHSDGAVCAPDVC
jgi:hypothetical protein